MSIMIKGMEMPKDCRECPVVQRTKSGLRCPILSKRDGFSHTASRGIIGRMGGCPLVEVPAPHGRLIDADALLEDVRKNSVSYSADDFAHEWVDVQSTVIEAEEGEDE